jgi:hypothetical protein
MQAGTKAKGRAGLLQKAWSYAKSWCTTGRCSLKSAYVQITMHAGLSSIKACFVPESEKNLATQRLH